MELLTSYTSPFGRKVRMFASEAGVNLPVRLTDPYSLPENLIGANPLSKIPVLMTDDPSCPAIIDSGLICEYLATKSAHPDFSVIPSWEVRSLIELINGTIETQVQFVMETRRPPELQSSAHLLKYREVVLRSLVHLESRIPYGNYRYQHLMLMCLLGYTDFRMPDLNWRESFPGLSGFYDSHRQRPSFSETTPPI